jgi:hypothetical protein
MSQLMVASDYLKPVDSKYKIAFVLQRSPSDQGLRIDDSADAPCFHEARLTEQDTTIISLESRHDWLASVACRSCALTSFGSVRTRFPFETRITEPGYYHLYFSNCEANTQVSFEVCGGNACPCAACSTPLID